MAKTVSGLLKGKLGAEGAKAVAGHGKDTTSYGNVEVPSGIDPGVAQLIDIHFGEYKEGELKGKLFFYASGTIVEPKEFNGIKTEGLTTSITEALCSTPNRSRKTVDDHMAWVLNELRKLGLDTSDLSIDDLESACESLKESAPYFLFRTWKGEPSKEFPNPRTNHVWLRATTYTEEGNPVEDAVEDNSEAAEETTEPETSEDSTPNVDEKELKAKAVKADKGDAKAQNELEGLAKLFNVDSESCADWKEVANQIIAASQNQEAEESDSAESSDSPGWEALGEAADGGDDEAISQLNEAAIEKGIDPNEYPTWGELATFLASQEEGSTETEIEKGLIVKYKAIDPKTKKAGKPVECEVVAVFDETVNLKNLDTGATYKSVNKSDLILE